MGLRLFARKEPEASSGKATVPQVIAPPEPYEPADSVALHDDPLKRQMQLERYGFVLQQREQLRGHPDGQATCRAAAQCIDEQFALVPEGFVSIVNTTNDFPGCPEEDVETVPFLLGRCCISNRAFQNFVDDGGYEALELWPEDIWPHLIDFKDATDQPGPRYWREGRHSRPLSEHPVVGICSYEAAAYTRWAGYRLPTGAEWQMAASWRVRSSAHVLRRYPWGDALDPTKCNLWTSGHAKTAPVTEYEGGAAPNGVLQLVGNVWEWTSSDYTVSDDTGRTVVGDMLMKEIRGGAYDTYFPSQATSNFRTGLPSLARAHNVGFRCAMDVDPGGHRDGAGPTG